MKVLNLNTIWSVHAILNIDYGLDFSEIFLPVAYGFKPDIINILCGLDATKEYIIVSFNLNPNGYYLPNQSFIEITGKNIPVVVDLEEECNIDVIK